MAVHHSTVARLRRSSTEKHLRARPPSALQTCVFSDSQIPQFDCAIAMHRRSTNRTCSEWSWSVWRCSLLFLLFLASSCTSEYIREFEISEGVPVGTSIGFIGESNPGFPRPPPPPYLIVPVPGSAVDSDLNIEQSTGEIRTKVVLDRETRPSYSLVAIPSTGENIRVVVTVKDENDNAPTFPTGFLQIEFPENTPRDVKRTLPPAKDPDLEIYNTQRYNIVSGNTNNAFRLSSHRERDGVLYLDLQINGFLDRETTAFYSLVIEALDGGSPPLRGVMTVNITIQDVNDNQPIFNQSRYFATIPENATLGTSVLQVFATDTDEGENGKITYSINRRQSDREAVFVIDPRTGVISVNRPLDFETKEVHELVVVASDNGMQPLETTAFVSIRVTDVNDNQPTINLIFLSDDATPKISEDAQPGDFVARISVNDPDSKEEYANVNVTLEGGEGHFGLTTRDNIIYLMIVSMPLDREMRPNYSLIVVATDQGSPPLHASRSFDLRVTDTNDNAPEFDQTVYYTNVLEVADPGTSVFQLSALDRDEGNNSMITYSILDSPDTHSDWFQIDSRTGLITTKKHIDCETDPVPQITVLAVDGGSPPLTGTATVLVTIRDVNDNEPIFDQSFYNVTVPEDQAVGHCILKVSATDPDCGVNALVNYTMGEGFKKYLEFEVQPSSGEICIAASLDHEKRSIYEFPVLATDRGGLSTTAMIKIQVTDVNDNRPTFYPREYNVSLREQEVSSGPVVVVVATDKDSGKYGMVRYNIVAGNEQGLFRIEPLSGEIFLTRGLSRTRLIHRLNISATDGGGLRSLTDAEVLITVIDSSQQPPIFHSARYLFSVREDAARNDVIGTVTATSVTGSDVRYSIYSGDPNGYFSINPVTGVIRTDSELDHETHPFVLLNVAAMVGDPPTFGHTQVNITIGDVNDNAPEFDTPVVKISVAENAELGVPIYAAHAQDLDSQNNGIVLYELLANPGNIFKIDPQHGFLTLNRHLDYETTQKYTIVISAYDRGVPPLRSNLTLHIEVQDVNDNRPTFEKEQYQVNVLESTPVNSQFLQVTAVDLDTGNNARLTYRIKEDELLGKFGIFPNSGSLYLKEALDREQKDRFTLTVVATDNGIPPSSAAATVNIMVMDANDNDPVFTKETYEFSVEENLEKGALVGIVSAMDKDIGMNAALRYTLSPANSSFQLNPLTGEISTRISLDRELKEVHELSVEVTDQGSVPRSARALVRVHVTDVNDNAPVIVEPEETVVGVREELPAGTEVIRVRAVDSDRGRNATISYSLVPGEGNDGIEVFTIDESTGAIRTKVTLDHEERAFYKLAIAARDHGNPPKETIRQLQIEVLDLNDNRPTFSTSSLTFKVMEGIRIGEEVGTVTAEDRDAGENGRVTYTIINGNLHGCFDINKTTGTLFVVREIDRELANQYTLQVKAVDSSATNPQSNLINVKIDVIDINDNVPAFKEDPVIFSISENTPIGTPVWNFSALDLDDGPNGIVQYSLTNQWPVSIFKINSNSGILTLIGALDYEQYPEFTLVVTATDQAEKESDRLSNSITVRVLIEDVNDNAPVFVSRTRVDIMEDEPIGYPLLHVIAVDRDSRDNGRVTYSITSGNEDGAFSLDSVSGILAVTRILDRESRNQYGLNVTATDHGKPSKSSWQVINIRVEDINDNPPHFLHNVYEASVAENVPVGTFVIKVTATDKDTGPNGNLTFSIPEGIADGLFSIHPVTGVVSTAGTIDREKKSSYILTIYVRDGSFPEQFDTATVFIEVLDVNDHAPEFKDSCYPLHVPENNDLSFIHTVVASDKDAGLNGEITYSITGGNTGNKFSIDMNTGQLSSRPLDREVKDRYYLIITAQDRGTPPRQGFCNITVTVDDENDNDPRFTQSRYTATISEDVELDTVVLTVRATDADFGSNAKITYSLSNETQWLFKIDNETGVISTAGYFDRERRSSYTFEVRATDGGRYDARSEKAQIHITIGDINDNKPVFVKYPFTAEVPAFTPANQQLLQVVAEDKDEGSNAEIVYSLINEGENSKFRIHPSTGVVTGTGILTMETGRLFHLEVLARDKGTPSLSSTGLIEIRVTDNSGTDIGAPPPVTLLFQNSTYEVNLQENSPVGKDVVQVSAVRSDGRRQRVTYSFGSGNEDSSFEINSNNGLIRVRDPKKLDYELSPKLRLIIVAQAEGTTPLYGYTTVWVNLQDQNDNAPRFTQDSYTASVWEGNNKGTFVVQVSATDSDSGSNAHVVYHIVDGNHDNAFVIEPAFSGIVKTSIVLDREIRDFYKLTIIATDEGSPQLTGTCTLRINIVDVNDNQPTFPPHSIVSVSEASEVGTVITTITANDVDTNPTLTYSFADGGNPNRMFSIDRFNGKITLALPLDHEKQQQYTIRVQASDMAHVTETSITVNVVDENDNYPVFSEQSYQAILPELTEPGYPVLTVNATDADEGLNADLRYSLAVSPMDAFSINEITGTIYTNRSLLFNPIQPVFQLVVKAQDRGKPSLASVVAVRIQISDVNNHPPKFSQDLYTAHVSEDATRGTIILHVSAFDSDETRDNRNIDFSIESGNTRGTFQITSDTGEILLVKAVDREETSVYNLKILAMDRGSPPRNSTTDVVIYIDDVNDNPPVFNQSFYEVSVSESQAVGTTLFQVAATDRDFGDNALLRYDITSGNNIDCFEVDPSTGVISLKKPLDFDKIPEYRFIIRATDSHKTHPLSAIAAVSVKVQDENDNSPTFPVASYLEFVPENAPVGTTVFQAHAIDKDRGVYGQLNYSIVGGDGADKFSIDTSSGVVITEAVFDYETRSKYLVQLQAVDIGGQSALVQVQIDVESQDEFSPEFTENSYRFSVPVNAEVGYTVGKVSATDRDKGPDGRVVYHLRNQHPNFKINKINGLITVRKRLDERSGGRRRRESISSAPLLPGTVSLVVVASSGRPGSLSNITVVEIVIDGPGNGTGLASAEQSTGGLADWAMGLLIAVIFLVLGFVAALIFLHMRHRKQSATGIGGPQAKPPMSVAASDNFDTQSQFDTLGYPPQYNDIPTYDHTDRRHRHANTSEMSEQSHSASSGRGSAEEGEPDADEDEEIRMINEGPLRQQQQQAKLQRMGMPVMTVPDSGIHADDDNLSDVSVHNTQEYLARLGINPARTDPTINCGVVPEAPHSHGHPHSHHSHGLSRLHIYNDDAGAEADSMDLSNLIYAKLNEDDASEREAALDGHRPFSFGESTQPSMTGSLSSIVHSEEELTGSYNWDYLLDWGPQYQPLAHVFGEIARLKDDSVPPSNYGAANKKPLPSKALPPPLITNIAPRTVVPVALNSGPLPLRQGQIASMPSMPRSPINHEGTFTSPAMSPSFSPSLSPLANRSPSISPMVPAGIGGGPKPQHHPRTPRSNIISGASSSSEAEMRL